jgi:hypothetical protein
MIVGLDICWLDSCWLDSCCSKLNESRPIDVLVGCAVLFTLYDDSDGWSINNSILLIYCFIEFEGMDGIGCGVQVQELEMIMSLAASNCFEDNIYSL